MDNTYEQGLKLIKEGKLDQAIAILEKVLLSDPNNHRALYALGVCYFKNNNYDKAAELFEEVLFLDNQNYKAYYWYGIVLEHKNMLNEAVLFYQSALSLKPDFTEARDRLISLNNMIEHHLEMSKTKSSAIPPEMTPEAVGGTLSDVLKRVSSENREFGKQVSGRLLYESKPRISSFGNYIILMILLPIFIWFIAPNKDQPIRSDSDTMLFTIFLLSPFIIFFYILLAHISTEYRIFEYRIDIKSGVINRKESSIWLYEIEDAWLNRTPIDLITNNATLHLSASMEKRSGTGSKAGQIAQFSISGLGDYEFMHNFWTEIRDAALIERRGMKNWWV